MNRAIHIVFALITVLVGFSVGRQWDWQLQPETPSSERKSGRPSFDPTPSESVAEQRTAPTGPSRPEDTKTTTTNLSRVLARISVPSFVSGVESLNGTVLGREGLPVVGAEVTAVIWGLTPGTEELDLNKASLEQFIRQEVDQYHYDRAMLRRTQTDEDGTFQLSNLKDAHYRVAATHPDWVILDVTTGTSRQAQPNRPLTLTAFEKRSLNVVVLGANGLPFPSTQLYGGFGVDQPDLMQSTVVLSFNADATPIEVPQSLSWLRARFPSEHWSEAVELRTDDSVVIRQKPRVGGRISGLLPGSRVRVQATALDATPTDSLDPETSSASDVTGSTTSRELDFDLSLRKPGRYRISVSGLNDPTPYDSVEIEANESFQYVDLALPLRPRENMLRIHASTPAGPPTLLKASIRSPLGQNSRITLDPLSPGVFEMSLTPTLESYELFGGPPEELTISLSTPGYGTLTAPFQPESPFIKVAFSAPTTFNAIVQPADSTEFQGRLTAQLFRDGAEGSADREWYTGLSIPTNGYVSFGPTSPGRYRLTIERSRGFNQGFVLWSQEILFPPKELPIRIELPTLLDLTVEFTGDHLGKEFVLSSEDHLRHYSRQSQQLSTDLSLHFASLPPGNYRLFSLKGGSMSLNIRESSVIQFESDRKESPR